MVEQVEEIDDGCELSARNNQNHWYYGNVTQIVSVNSRQAMRQIDQ